MKLLASDFDLTLFTNELEIQENRKAIEEFRKQGNIFVIATGRYLPHLLRDAQKYDIPFDYVICNDGGKIFDCNLNCISTTNIPSSVVVPIVNKIKENDNIIEWHIDTGLEYTHDTSKAANAIIAHPEDKDKARVLLTDIINEFSDVHGYISDNWINITQKSVNKSYGINKLITLIDFPKDQVYTIGDNINDYEMIKDYHGAIMECCDVSLSSLNNKHYASVAEFIFDLLKKEEQK